MPPIPDRSRTLAELRAQLAAQGGAWRWGEAGGRRAALSFGLAPIDGALPWGGLPLGCLHEVTGGGDPGASSLFVAGLAARLEGPVLWCLRRADLYAPGLAARGLLPERLLIALATSPAGMLWAMEEGLRHGGLAAVIGEPVRLGLTAGRRLQLAAESSATTAFALLPPEREGREPSAAVTRWRVTPAPSPPLAVPGLGRARWRLELLRCRGGAPGSWIVEACDATGRLALPAGLADRPAAAAGAHV